MLKKLHSTKDNLKQKRHSIKIWSMLMMVLIICMQFSMFKDYAIAASGVRIYNYTTKKEYTYTDAQIKVTYNGKKISVDSTPGILQNGIALVSYKDIFAKSGIKADCVYDKKAGTVSISKFGITIVMKIGSKTAYINGKEVTAPLAPVKIKYVKENVTKILVPSRFVSENLGFNYTWHKNTSTVAIERKQMPMLLSYNEGEPFYYTGTQGRVTIDGKSVDLGNMPSIITNNTAMLRAKRVFADSVINADYKYNSKDKTITLSRKGNTLVMKIGSPVAHLNDRAIVLDTPPMIITNHDVGTSYVMVPGSITASCLGFDYRWDKTNATSVITSRNDDDYEEPQEQLPDNEKETEQNQKEEPEQTQDAPELGDSHVTWDPGKILYQWEANKNLIEVGRGIHKIENNSKTKGTIYAISRDYSRTNVNAETYAIYASVPFGTVTSSVKGKQIQLNISNLNCSDYTYHMRDYSDAILDTVRSYTVDSFNSRLEFNLINDKFSYDLSLSSDKQILYITIYHNSLNKVTIGSNDTMDYISLTGNWPLDVVIDPYYNVINVKLPGTKKAIEDRYILDMVGSKNLSYTYIYYTPDGTHLVLGLNEPCDYYISEDDNVYTIMIPTKEKPFTPVVPNKPDKPDISNPVIPTNPDIKDKNIYEIIIPNPGGLSVSQIKHEDQYSKLRFSIRLPGDYVSYLNNYPITVNSSVIKDVSVFLNTKNETEILISTSKIQGYELFADQNYIYVNVGNPKEIYKNIVVLDPGHGGPAPGAHYFNTYEKTINFKILYEIGKDFFNSDPSKLKVYYTRETDVDVSLADRAAFAQQVGADLFVSLHMNANTNKSVYGTEVYYSESNNKKNKAGLNSEILAKLFVNNLSSSLNTKNRGIRAARYTVVHKNTVPAVLIELGFMSNKDDFAKISDPGFQYKAAKVIYETLLQVFELYPTGR